MNNRKLNNYCIVLLFFLINYLNKSDAQSLKGIVYDATTNKTVQDVYVLNHNNELLSNTDQDGFFEIKKENVPLYIRFLHIGYHEKNLKPVTKDDTLIIKLIPASILLDSVLVSAELRQTNSISTPAFTRSVSLQQLSYLPSTNIDLFLKKVPGINVNRSWGIFSKNSSVTMRGLTNSASVLITLDGVPLNKLAGGSINWNLMSSNSLSRIEVTKGPVSAQYGMNAMGGCINLQTITPNKPFESLLTLHAGTYQTRGFGIYAGGKNNLKKISNYWSIDISDRIGDGYIYFPDNAPSPLAQKTYLKELSVLVKDGIIWKNKHSTQLGFLYCIDKRGEGIKVYEPNGSYNSYNTNILWMKHNYNSHYFNTSVLGFITIEDFFRQNENINSSFQYQYYETNSQKGDRGIKINSLLNQEFKKNKIGFGLEIRQGDVDASDRYYSSTDFIHYSGNLLITGVYIQNDYSLTENILCKLAMRYDIAWFSDGILEVKDPSATTLFMNEVNEHFENKQWNGFSPKVSVLYTFDKYKSVYASFAKGYLPPKIEDMTKSGKIRKGFKQANPNLYPEKLDNYETGFKLDFEKKLFFNGAFYHSKGKDFQYFISKGSKIEVSEGEYVQLLQKTNIAGVSIWGFDMELSYNLFKNLQISANYAYNSSKINDVESTDLDVLALKGLYLAEVPRHIVNAFIDFSYRNFFLSGTFNYTSEQWYDDENTEIVDSYELLNLKISKLFFSKYTASIGIEDVFNQRFIDRKGYLSPGRFIIAEIKLRI